MQQHDINFWLKTSPQTLGIGSKGQNLKKNQNMVMWHIKLKKSDMQHHDSKNPPPQTLGVGSKGQNPTFSNHGHVVYQIK